MADERFDRTTYTVRRKVLKLVGGAFHIFGDDTTPLFYAKMKAFTLREDIRLYTGEDMTQEVLSINARKIIDFAAAYDVVDASDGSKVGALKRKGWKSMLRDHWILMGPQDQEIGTVREDTGGLAFARRFLPLVALFAPQRYDFEVGGRVVATAQQNHNIFVYKLTLDFGADQARVLDRRLAIAAALLFAAIERKQRSG
ncbi:MAG TPA: hypothetical protein VGB83_02060 [Actinomycetota bacterium]